MNNFSIDYRKILGIDLNVDALIFSQSPNKRVDVQHQQINEAIKYNFDNDPNVYQYNLMTKQYETFAELTAINDVLNAEQKNNYFILTIKFS